MSVYEFTFMINQEEDIKELQTILKSFSVKVTEENAWGERKLAYPIKKLTSSKYFTWKLELDSKNLSELKNKLNFNEKITRYLILKISD